MATKGGQVTVDILGEVAKERARQYDIFGTQDHSLNEWYTILGEEVGEVAQAILEEWRDDVRTELIQVAAVCVAMIEDLDDKDQS